jgi:hypothetical protein
MRQISNGFSDGAVQGQTGGGVTYGGLDTTHCGPMLAWVPLSAATYYQFNMDGYDSILIGRK